MNNQNENKQGRAYLQRVICNCAKRKGKSFLVLTVDKRHTCSGNANTLESFKEDGRSLKKKIVFFSVALIVD